jgi:hypothetical protein
MIEYFGKGINKKKLGFLFDLEDLFGYYSLYAIGRSDRDSRVSGIHTWFLGGS